MDEVVRIGIGLCHVWLVSWISCVVFPLSFFTLLIHFLLLQCGSARSVAPIKAGFVARVGRRKAGP